MRERMRAARRALPPRARALEEELVNAAIQADSAWASAGTVLLYRNVRSEFSVVGAANAAFRDGKRVCFPRVVGTELSLHAVTGWHALAPGAFGIQEPAAADPEVAAREVDVAVVPGLAFDDEGHRLGQGGGFYDRLLPRLPLAWGVCFDAQRVPALPREAHDVHVARVWHAAAVR